MCLCYILYFYISGLLLDITHLCNRTTMITLILIRDDTEKVCSNNHTPINKL